MVMTGANDADPGARPRWRWDVALSFADAQRDYVEQVAAALKARGVRCFYYADEQIELWGKYLAEELPAIYGEQAAVVVVFVSADYAARDWTRLERRAALARAVREQREYVLPARFDDTPLPGLLPDMVTVDLRTRTPQQFAAMIADKLAIPSIAASTPPTERGSLVREAGSGRPAGVADSQRLAGPPPGWPLAEVSDPFTLEVHRPVQPDHQQLGLPELPEYVPREHDGELGQVVMAAAGGKSGIAVLVGGSSTGKTRACWQALKLLRDLEPEWQLWHPIDPSPPQAALAGLRRVEPRTVVWLNEAQRYFVSLDGAGERVAAGLRELIRSPDSGPVLVLATLWPEHWSKLTARPAGTDPHAQARELLAGHDIPVASKFTSDQMRELQQAADPRLAQAAAGSPDGQVVQYLAGAPDLLDRYRNGTPAARALIEVAMDARRLGMGPALPLAFLEAAAPGYLSDTDHVQLRGNWLKSALDYTAEPAKGVRGPLAPILHHPEPGSRVCTGDRQAWQLADYLDQHGRRTRRELMPPASFWAAAASYADPADLGSLGDAAEDRGLYRDAASLYKKASGHGDPLAAAHLVHLLHTLHPDDRRPVRWALAHARLDNPAGAGKLLFEIWLKARPRQFTRLARRAAAQASLDDTIAVQSLIRALSSSRRTTRPLATLVCRAAAHVSLDDPGGVAELLRDMRLKRAAPTEATALANRAAAHVSLNNPGGVAALLHELGEREATAQVTALLDRNPAAQVSLDDPGGVAALLRELAWARHKLASARLTGQITALLDRNPAAHVSLDDPGGVASLLHELRELEATGQVTALLDRNPAAHASLDKLFGPTSLLRELKWAGATGQVTALASRVAAHASLDDPYYVAKLLAALHEVGATAQATALASRAAAHASLDHPWAVAELLDSLREAGATDQVDRLLDRDPAAHVSLDDPYYVAKLLAALHEAGATSQVTALASRAAAHLSLDNASGRFLDNSSGVTAVLDTLRSAGARAQAAELIRRLLAEGKFQLYSQQEGGGEQFRFGREADGRLAKPWTWTDLS